MSNERTLADDLATQISNYKARRAECEAEIAKLQVKSSEFTMRIMELENILDKHK
jgi:uncharacterized coiled-coil DUF342 family protein